MCQAAAGRGSLRELLDRYFGHSFSAVGSTLPTHVQIVLSSDELAAIVKVLPEVNSGELANRLEGVLRRVAPS
jgi:hypothetical protein